MSDSPNTKRYKFLGITWLKVVRSHYYIKKYLFGVLIYNRVKIEKIAEQIQLTESNFERKITESFQALQPVSAQKDGGQIFIFAGVPYYDIGAGQRCAQLAKTFSQMGYRVYYYYVLSALESVRGIHIPALVHKPIETVSIEEIMDVVTHNAVFVFEAPSVKFIPYLNKAHKLGIKTIYEHIDNWETSLGSLLYDSQSFRSFIDKSAHLIATSVELVKQLQSCTDKNIIYAPNAVDVNLFEPSCKRERPSDLVSGKNKTLLYFGSLWGEWFDWNLLRSVMEACPDSVVNMIGDCNNIPHVKIETLPENIVFLGPKKQTELPAYLAYSDIAILPFKNCDIGRYVSPLKIFEYIAMNKKVLATPLPDIIGYPNTICSEDANDWVSLINSDISVENAIAFVSDNSWYNRCNTLLDTCGLGFCYPETKISIIVLNHNNASTIFRCVESLLKHSNNYRYEVIVVDNCSSDGSYEKLLEIYRDKVTVIRNDHGGCASGRNLGVEKSSGDILVFLDGDQWVVNDRWLDCALYLIYKYPGLGALSWSAGWFDSGKAIGDVVDNLPNRAISPNQFYRNDVAYLRGGGMIMKRVVFACTGGFDTAYDPISFEDTDISFQIKNLGLKAVYCPLIGIMRVSSRASEADAGSSSCEKLMQKNEDYFIKKWIDKNPGLLQKAWGYRG